MYAGYRTTRQRTTNEGTNLGREVALLVHFDGHGLLLSNA